MRILQRKYSSGVTLIEVLIVVAILGIAVLMMRVVVDMLNVFFQNSATAETQRDVQLALFSISSDIRNCEKVLVASSGTLQMTMYDLRGTYSTLLQPNLFEPTNIGTMTYRYEIRGNDSYLIKTTEYPSSAPEEKRLLRNMLLQPDTTNYLFNACDAVALQAGDRCPPGPIVGEIRAVDIRLTVSPLYVKNSFKTYTTQVLRRSR